MCGIWFSFNLSVERSVIDVIRHRGPDGDGWRTELTPTGPVTMGHRRLAILDLDARGNQPMAYGNGRYWIVYNGEIYNYLELREELLAKGHVFTTNTDTEVLLAAFAQWNTDCLDRLNGMFAFAIWDRQENRLFAARDRFGIKPLYLWRQNGAFAIASEIKQFLSLPRFQARANSKRLLDFLVYGLFNHTNETQFDNVIQLRGGQYLDTDLCAADCDLRPHTWYELGKADQLQPTLHDAAEQFHDLLADSVRLRLRADVPVGSCLSGGLDSTSIVSLVGRLLKNTGAGEQHVFSAVFTDKGLDERPYIDAVVDATNAHAHRVTPAAEDLSRGLDQLLWHQEEPIGSTSMFAQWEVFRAAREAGVIVMLDGQGADEQLAGYHTMLGAHLAGPLLSLDAASFLREWQGIRRRHGTGAIRLLGLMASAILSPSSFSMVARLAGRRMIPDWLTPQARSEFEHAVSPFHPNRAPGETPLGALCKHLMTQSSLPMLLHYEDRNSMAHSIEARVPFLDYRLVEFCIALTSRLKIIDGETKAVQRAAMRDVLPPLVRDRQDKLGFATPEDAWLRALGANIVSKGVDSAVARFGDLIDADGATREKEAFLSGNDPKTYRLWRLVSTGLWAERFNLSGTDAQE